jgi:predicted nucleic acid-binding protein
MIYLDTSCLMKLLVDEPESADVRNAVEVEDKVVVSQLTELEAEVQLKGAVTGGSIRISQWRQLQAKLTAMRNFDPFHFKPLPASVFATALRRHRHPQSVFCRAMDRLHVAAMEELGLTRLMTLDEMQAKVAAGLGYKIVRPGRD